MRLTTPQVASIINSCHQYCQNKTVELRLFGHRVKDDDEGNDIGLLLITENETDLKELDSHKASIKSSIIQHIGNQPVEIVIVTRDGLRINERAHALHPTSMFLYTYYK